MDAVESKDKRRIAAVRREIKEKTAKTPLPSAPEAIGTPLATPLPTRDVTDEATGSVLGSAAAGTGEEAAAAPSAPITLDQFQAEYTTEDNVSFEDLLARTQARKKQAYWWAYDSDAVQRTAGLAIANRPHHAEFDDSVKHIEDREARPPGPHTWKHRTMNQLMFLPDLAISNETSGVKEGAAASAASSTDLTVPFGYGVSKEGGLMAPKVIKHANTRFTPSERVGLEAEVRAPSLPPTAIPVSDGVTITESATAAGYGLVRSPSPTPGAAGDEPEMTWGDIEGTPMILDARLAGDDLCPSDFRVPTLGAREALAHALEAKNKAKAGKRPRSTSTQRSAGSGTLTPLMVAHMTPHAQSLAERVWAAKGGGRLGADPSLRASYSGATPSRAPGVTPKLTPKVTPLSKTPARPMAPSARPAPPANLTDGLLKLP